MVGETTEPSARAGRRWPSIFLAGVTLAWAAALACFAFVGVVDPYQLRSVRPGERLADHPYPAQVVPRLVSVAANGDTDMVVLGASTALAYTPNMLREAFPDVRHPANLAFACADPEDYRLLLPRLERSRTLKRVLISLDVSLIANCVGKGNTDFDPRYFVQDWWDPVPEFSVQSLELSATVLRTGIVDAADWRALPDDRVPWITTSAPMTADRGYMARVRRFVALARGKATAGQALPCSAIPSLNTTIAPFVREMASRGVQVDLLAPPLSLAVYSEWSVSWTPFKSPAFPSVMALERCALQMTAGLPNVRFDSFDTDPSIVGNPALYRDTEHIGGVDTYRELLRRIASGKAQVQLEEWPQHEATLKREIDTFAI